MFCTYHYYQIYLPEGFKQIYLKTLPLHSPQWVIECNLLLEIPWGTKIYQEADIDLTQNDLIVTLTYALSANSSAHRFDYLYSTPSAAGSYLLV